MDTKQQSDKDQEIIENIVTYFAEEIDAYNYKAATDFAKKAGTYKAGIHSEIISVLLLEELVSIRGEYQEHLHISEKCLKKHRKELHESLLEHTDGLLKGLLELDSLSGAIGSDEAKKLRGNETPDLIRDLLTFGSSEKLVGKK